MSRSLISGVSRSLISGLRDDLYALLVGMRGGEIEPGDVLDRLVDLPFRNLGFARPDIYRELRQGSPGRRERRRWGGICALIEFLDGFPCQDKAVARGPGRSS